MLWHRCTKRTWCQVKSHRCTKRAWCQEKEIIQCRSVFMWVSRRSISIKTEGRLVAARGWEKDGGEWQLMGLKFCLGGGWWNVLEPNGSTCCTILCNIINATEIVYLMWLILYYLNFTLIEIKRKKSIQGSYSHLLSAPYVICTIWWFLESRLDWKHFFSDSAR